MLNVVDLFVETEVKSRFLRGGQQFFGRGNKFLEVIGVKIYKNIQKIWKM